MTRTVNKNGVAPAGRIAAELEYVYCVRERAWSCLMFHWQFKISSFKLVYVLISVLSFIIFKMNSFITAKSILSFCLYLEADFSPEVQPA